VLPAEPTAQEIETFLTLMGHFSRQTGYPALRVAVAGADALKAGAAADFLIIGTGDDQPPLTSSAASCPSRCATARFRCATRRGSFAPVLHRAWWKFDAGEPAESGDITAGGTPESLIEGLKSPYGRRR
jgi:cellulose synthase (UDP-forming)